MKRLYLISMFAALTIAIVSCDAKDKVIAPDQLPASVQSFVKSYFPSCDIIYAEYDKDYIGDSYEVKLDCMVDIEFDENGNWKKVECESSNVPDEIVPIKILNYVRNNYAKYFIVKIDKNKRYYEVELNVGLDLLFDLDCNFVRIDD